MLAAVLAIAWTCLVLAICLVRDLGVTGINVVTRVPGLVVAGLAVQFVLDGPTAVGAIAGA